MINKQLQEIEELKKKLAEKDSDVLQQKLDEEGRIVLMKKEYKEAQQLITDLQNDEGAKY